MRVADHPRRRRPRRGSMAAVVIACMTIVLAGCAVSDPIRSPSASVGPATSSPGPVSPTASTVSPPPTAHPTGGDRLEIVCNGTATVVDVPIVVAQADGLHLELVNVTGDALALEIDHGVDGPVLQQDGLETGGAVVAPLAPGSYEITCGGPAVPFAIVDPTRIHLSATLGCVTAGGSGTTGSIDHAPDARGPRGALVDIARRELSGLRENDRVERAGYPADTTEHVVRVVRGGAVVAALSFDDDGHGGWLLSATRACAGSGLSAASAD